MACSRAPEPRTRIFTRPAYRAVSRPAAVHNSVSRDGPRAAGACFRARCACRDLRRLSCDTRTVEPCPARSRPTRAARRSRPCGRRRRIRHPGSHRSRDSGPVPAAAARREGAGSQRRGAGAAVRRRAGRRGSAPHPRHAAERRRDRRRDLDRARPRRRSSGRMLHPPAASWHPASAPTCRTCCRCAPDARWPSLSTGSPPRGTVGQ